MAGVSIQNLTRSPIKGRRSAFSSAAAHLLPGWEVSLVFVGPSRARLLNTKLRKKDYTPNVLSYAVGEKSAEIIICPSEAARQAPSYGLAPATFILFLFIHGALHIKGWVHGGTMEQCEQKLLARFARGTVRAYPYGTTNRNRHRHRHLPGKDSRRRRTLR